MSFMLDTNVFNHILDGKIQMEDLPTEFPILITHIQMDEILNCKDEHRKSALYGLLKTLPDQQLATESTILGISRLGASRLGSGDIYSKILNHLNSKKRRKNKANEHDALIGETAIKNNLVLITNDQALGEIVRKLGGLVRDHLVERRTK